MFQTQRAQLLGLVLGIVSMVGCGSYGGGGGGGGGSAAPGATSLSAALAWDDATGPVAAYRVYVSRNGAAFAVEQDVPSAQVTIGGEEGETVRIRVAALDADGNQGPLSPRSAQIRFTASGVVAGNASASTAIASTSGGSADTRAPAGDLATRSQDEPQADPGAQDALLTLASQGTAVLLWEADAPSLALQLTSLSDGTLRAELAFERPGEDWWVVGAEDFDGDGGVDVLWESAAGMLALSSLSRLVDSAPMAPLTLVGSLRSDEVVVSTGDYDGDGRADLLVEDEASGLRTVWLMSESGQARIQDLRGLDLSQGRIAASGDFDGDGRADLLTRAEDGSVAIHFMDAAVAVAHLALPGGEARQPLASGDVDGDGDDDLVVRDVATGTVDVWLMGARRAPDAWNHPVGAGAGWDVAGIGDFDGDGDDDLLWTSGAQWLIGFHDAAAATPEWLPVDPAGDWVLVSFAL